MIELIKIMLIMLLILFVLSPEMAIKVLFAVIGFVLGLFISKNVRTRKEK